MKIGIITFHRADNYGALLQTYALQRKFVEKGNSVDIIDYRCTAIEKWYVYNWLPFPRKNVIAWCMECISNPYVIPKKRIMSKRCSTFRDKFLHISRSYNRPEDRLTVQKAYNLIVTGSDQIWNIGITDGKDDWYCFKKNVDMCTIVAYGASVGNQKAFSNEIKCFKAELENYDMISTREKETKDYLDEILNKEVFCVLDPTLLVTRTEWDNLVSNSEMKIDYKYIIYYDVSKNVEAEKIARDLAKKTGYKLLHFNRTLKMLFRGGYVQEAGPIEFLWLIKNAEYVVTSSFHATVFSIIFEKNFWVVPHPQTGERVRSLLYDIHLEDHIVEGFKDYVQNGQVKITHFTEAKELLDLERKKSEAYIDACMAKVRND